MEEQEQLELDPRIRLLHTFEPFRGDSGSWCKPQPIEDGGGFWLPLGWEDELTARGIEFDVVKFNALSEEEDLAFKIISEDGVITDQEKQENPSLWDKIKSWWNS
jgi:hypothetical protein